MVDKPSYDPRHQKIKAPLSLNTRLEEAVSHHQQGRFEQAEKIYRQIIEAYPTQPDAWHLLGVLALQAKDYTSAHQFISRAIELAPNTAEYHFNQAMAFAAEANYADALAEFQQAATLKTDYYEAFLQAGMVQTKLYDWKAAEQLLLKAAAIKPDMPDAHYQVALMYRQVGNYAAATEAFKRVLTLRPDAKEVYLNLGYTYKLAGDLDAAIENYNHALRISPNDPVILNMRGVTYIEQREIELGIQDYQAALKLQPDFAEVYNNLGIALFEQGQAESAVEAFGRALQLQKDFIQPYVNLATAYEKLGKLDAALEYYNKAIQQDASIAYLHLLKGLCLHKTQQFEAALTCLDQSIVLDPNNPLTYNARGATHYELANYAAAKADYAAALRLDPEHGDANTNLAFLKLLEGDLLEGFERYEWRWFRPDCLGKKPCFEQPEWTGQAALTGKTVLVYAEQGYGDTIQMMRYLKKIAALSGSIIFQVDAALVKLFSTNVPTSVKVISNQDRLPVFDFHISLMSLPFRFMTDFKSIPAEPRYIKANLQRRSFWELRFGVKKHPRIGLVWHTRSVNPVDAKRCIPLPQLLANLPNKFEYFSFQKSVNPEELVLLSQHSITALGDKFLDFNETAALLDCMDLVVTIDTSIAHLAGALGKPTWILLPLVPDWRWQLHDDHSPWYPTVRLFRQQQRAEWGSVIDQVIKALREY